MVSVTFAIPDEIKIDMKELSWVNWSEITKKELYKKIKQKEMLKEAMKLIDKSKFTEKDAQELSEKIKKSMHSRLKKEGLI